METEINKIIRPGTIDTGNGRRANVYCRIKYRDKKLSISGVIGPTVGGNAIGGCGQIDMEFAHRKKEDDDSRYGYLTKPSDFRFAKGWDSKKWLDFLDVWKQYHLNNMQAGCEHQRKLGWKRYGDHPSEPCPVCGYKYGTAWLMLDVPEEVITFLKGLPETDKEPAWV